jgi:ABC-type phosphate transport system substrate-binding protein
MRALPATAALLTLTLTLVCAKVLADGRALPTYQVIVHPSNRLTTLDRKFLQDAFLKKITRWPESDAVIRPVDLAPGSRARHAFSDDVLSRSVEAVKGYWQQRIFSGRDVPPPELDSDEEVVRFVLKYDGAVGYISGGASPLGSKIVDVR